MITPNRTLNFLLAGALAATAGAAVSGAEPDPVASLRAWRGDQPGGVVAAVIDRDGTRFHADGTFDRGNPEPVGPDTFFEIGSITKVFTALLLADAVERGEVALDDSIATRTGLAAPASITFEQLATHHAGLPRMPADFVPASPLDPFANQDLAKLEASLAGAALTGPGTRFEYSNFGAAVLGVALAKVTSRPYAQLLRGRVLDPLDMDAASLDWHTVDSSRLAPGHADGGITPNWTLRAYAPAGGLVMTARDLAKLAEVALGLRESSVSGPLATCLEPHAEGERPGMRVGLAWMVSPSPGGATVTWHNGGTGGYRSFIGFNRATGRGVVLLTNHDTPIEPLAFALLDGRTYEPHKAAPPAPELAAYVGRYPLAPSFVITISADGSRLFAQATRQPLFELKADGPDRFSLVGVEAQIEFVHGPDGAIEALILHQNGMDQRAPRRDEAEPPRTEIHLDAAALGEYAGRYPIAPGFELTVTVEGDALLVQATNQPKLPVFADAPDHFFYKVVNAELTFERNAKGRVRAVVLHQNGRDLRGPRREP